MKVLVFDDNPTDLALLNQFIRQWSDLRNHSDLILRSYQQYAELKFAIEDVCYYDVFFMDIMTPANPRAGFELAERIHELNPSASIVFTTYSKDFYNGAFEISALRYLLKPMNREKVFKILDALYSSASKRKAGNAALLPGFNGTIVVELDKILYIEAKTSRHLGIIHFIDGTSQDIPLTAVSFSGLIEKLHSSDFFRCHRGTIINLNHITQFNRDFITLNHSVLISLGDHYRTQFLNRVADHFMGTFRYAADDNNSDM